MTMNHPSTCTRWKNLFIVYKDLELKRDSSVVNPVDPFEMFLIDSVGYD